MWISDIRLDAGWLTGAAIAIAAVSPVEGADKYVFGRCATATQSEGAEIRPAYAGGSYLFKYHGDDPRYKEKLSTGEFFAGAKVKLVNVPKHGGVTLVDTSRGKSNNWYHYMPNEGYIGRDRFSMEVEKDGVKVLIHYLIEVLNEGEPSLGICQPAEWKINAIPSAIPSLTTLLLDASRSLLFTDLTGISVVVESRERGQARLFPFYQTHATLLSCPAALAPTLMASRCTSSSAATTAMPASSSRKTI